MLVRDLQHILAKRDPEAVVVMPHGADKVIVVDDARPCRFVGEAPSYYEGHTAPVPRSKANAVCLLPMSAAEGL